MFQEVRAHLCSLSCRAEPRQVPLALITQLTPSSQGTTPSEVLVLQQPSSPPHQLSAQLCHPTCTSPAPAQDPAVPPQPCVPSGGSSHPHLPLTLQQQQNQICFANELAEQLLDASAPSQSQAVHSGPCCSWNTKPQRQILLSPSTCTRQHPPEGMGRDSWGSVPQIPACASSLLPSYKALQLKGSQIGAVFNITAENERHYQRNCRVRKPGQAITAGREAGGSPQAN